MDVVKISKAGYLMRIKEVSDTYWDQLCRWEKE